MKKSLLMLLVIPLLALLGCDDDPVSSGDDTYFDLSHPDSLVKTLVEAWGHGEIDGYSNILYGGEADARDLAHPEFTYYYNYDAVLPVVGALGRDLELEAVGHMLAGDEGTYDDGAMPGITSVEMIWSIREGGWADVSGATAHDDLCPDGTLAAEFDLEATVSLHGGQPELNVLLIDDRMKLWVIPVIGDEGTEYRLWKWEDLIPAVEPLDDDDFTTVKLFYLDWDPQPPVAVDLTTPEGLADAFEQAWSGLDADIHEGLLYDGETDVPGMLRCHPFQFIFACPECPDILVDAWRFADESACVGNMFGGVAGEDWQGQAVPPIRSITPELVLTSGWTPLNGGLAGACGGDAHPAGAMSAQYTLSLTVRLTGPNAAGFDTYQVDAPLQFVVIPVEVEGAPEYRLWKLTEIDTRDPGTEVLLLFGELKSLYHRPAVAPEPAFDTPAHLIDAFEQAWNGRDVDGYEAALFAAGQAVPGALDCREFEFHFTDPDAPGIPGVSWYFASEMASVGNMFTAASGEDQQGHEVPPVHSIAASFVATAGGWSALNGGAAGMYEGDEFPAGTMSAVYETDFLVCLSGPNGDGYDAYQVNGYAEFLAIPVLVEGATEYRLWKWREIYAREGARATEFATIGGIKALF